MVDNSTNYTFKDYKMVHEYLYTCTYCRARNWSRDEGSTAVKCGDCGKVFIVQNGLGGVMSRWVREEIEPIKLTFKERIDKLIEKFPPDTVHICDEFAVFEYPTMVDLYKLADDKRDNPDKYEGIYHDHHMCKLVLIDMEAKEKCNAT